MNSAFFKFYSLFTTATVACARPEKVALFTTTADE